MRPVKRLLKYLGFTVLALVGLALIAGAVLWVRPGLLLNERMVRWAAKHFASDTQLSWSQFRWDTSARGTLEKRSDLEISGLCVRRENLDACFNRLHVDLVVSLRGFRPHIVEITRVAVVGREITVHPGTTPKPAHDLPLPDLRLGKFADYFPPVDLSLVRELELWLPKVTLESKDGEPLLVQARIGKEDADAESMHLRAEASARQGAKTDIGTSLRLTIAAGRLQAKGSFRGKFGAAAVITPLDLEWAEELRLALRLSLRTGGKRYQATTDLRWSAERLQLEVAKLFVPGAWPGRKVRVESCRLDSRLDQSAGFPRKGSVRCELSAVARARQAPLPELRASAELHFQLNELRSDTLGATLDFIAHSSQDIAHSDLRGKVRLEFANATMQAQLLEPELHADVNLPRFDLLEAAVAKTRFAVPAPFQDFRGNIRVTADLSPGARKDAAAAEVQVDTNLGYAAQKLRTHSVVHANVKKPLDPHREIFLDGTVLLQDVALSAPPARLEEPPQVGLDRRFKTAAQIAEEKKQAKSNFHYRLAVRTEQPIRIFTTLQTHPLPLGLNLELRDRASPDGTVAVQPMPLKIFGRRMSLDHLDLDFRPGSEKIGLDGRVVYPNPEATVRINFLGSTDEPRLQFESDPPLSQQQIISLLLFNKSIAELTEEEANSTTSLSQALSTGAFGLFSLFFLSSTPIESVGYDPASGAYSVRMRLDNRTTVTASSDLARSRSLGLRRRLGKRWAISTEVHLQDESGNGVLTLLEWFKRF